MGMESDGSAIRSYRDLVVWQQAMQLAVVAAGFTAGRADELRRSMAAWKRKGGIGGFRDELLSGMKNNEYTLEFAESLYRQLMILHQRHGQHVAGIDAYDRLRQTTLLLLQSEPSPQTQQLYRSLFPAVPAAEPARQR